MDTLKDLVVLGKLMYYRMHGLVLCGVNKRVGEMTEEVFSSSLNISKE